MKKIYLFAFAILFGSSAFSQTPEKMTYQAVVRDASNSLLANQSIGMQVSILQGSATGTPVYVETLNPTTNNNGLVTVEIGTGTIVLGDFSSIDWGNGPYFIMTETDPAGGANYTITGTSQLLSVPYALHAKTAESISGTLNETDPIYAASIAAGITGADTSAWNNKLDTELDGDPTNEIELPVGGSNGQVLQTDGSGNYSWVNQAVLNEAAVDLYVSNNGYITSPDDADADPTNEIELPIGGVNGYVLQTNGSGVYTWVPQTTDTQLDETAVDAFVANNGYITSPNDADSDPTNEIELPSGGLNGYVLQTNGSGVYSWTPQTVDTDTQLDEAAVDAFVANNGYLTVEADADPTNEIELPAGGNNGDILQTDGAGNYAWVAPAGGVEADPVYGASPAASISNTDITNWNNKLDTELDGDPTNEIELPAGGSNGQVLQTDGSGNYTWVNQTVDTDTQLNEAAVDAFVANNGYITSPNDADSDPTNEIELPAGGSNGQLLQTDGAGNYSWVSPAAGSEVDPVYGASPAAGITNTDITNWNNKLDTELDGDPTNEIELPAGGSNGQVLQTDGSGNYTWVNQTVDTDTQLNEAAVDAFVANNGYITSPNDADADPTNEIELPAGGSNGDMLITDGAGNYSWTAPPSGGGGGTSHKFYLGQDTLGGIVFFLYEDLDGTQHGLLVSKDEGFGQMCSNTGTLLPTNTSYDGETNTTQIVGLGSTAGTWCQGHGAGWYLPSIDELTLLFNRRGIANIGIVAAGGTVIRHASSSTIVYWSSTQGGSATMGLQMNAQTFQIAQTTKTALTYVRAVKKF
ncbi:MAG: hypothetical protein R2799_04085 [Crocinitomicaceae bacterium]